METYKENLGKVAITIEKDYWDIKKVYDRLVVVERQGTGTCFISRKPVPSGVSILNREYWIKFSKWADIPYEIVQEFGDSEELTISQKVLTEKIDQLQDMIEHIHPGNIGVAVNVTPNIVFENTSSSVIIKANMVNGAIANRITIRCNNEVYQEENVVNIEHEFTIQETTTIQVTAEQDGFTYEAISRVLAVNPIYVGASTSYENIYNDDDYKQTIRATPAGTYTVVVSTNGDSVYFIIPDTMTIDRATMSGFEFPLEAPRIDLVEGYKVYESSNTYDDGNLIIQIS